MQKQSATRKRRKPSRLWHRTEYDERSVHVAPKYQHLESGVSNQTSWRLRQRGEFPEPVPLSPGRVAYIRRELREWAAARAAARTKAAS